MEAKNFNQPANNEVSFNTLVSTMDIQPIEKKVPGCTIQVIVDSVEEHAKLKESFGAFNQQLFVHYF